MTEKSHEQHPHIILASTSPRRKQILHDAGIDFDVMAPDVPEHVSDKIAHNPKKAAQVIAERKAGAAVQQLLTDTQLHGLYAVVAADTIVALNNTILGKPHGSGEARKMLMSLSGKTHRVITGVSLWMVDAYNALHDERNTSTRNISQTVSQNSHATSPDPHVTAGHTTFADVSYVTFHTLDRTTIDAYLATGESFDKAGAYAIQGKGRKLVKHLEGDYDNVVGLPLEKMKEKFPQIFD